MLFCYWAVTVRLFPLEKDVLAEHPYNPVIVHDIISEWFHHLIALCLDRINLFAKCFCKGGVISADAVGPVGTQESITGQIFRLDVEGSQKSVPKLLSVCREWLNELDTVLDAGP